MNCLACGAEMLLMQMEQRSDPSSEVAFERHTFKCSACPQISRRLVFSRPRLPITDLGLAPPPRFAPSATLQMKRFADANALAKVAENLRSRRRQIATEARAAAPMASIMSEGFEKHRSQDTPVQERQDRSPRPKRTSTWAEVVEKVRVRQIVIQERAGALSRSRTPASNPPAGETQNREDLGGGN
jgi:hypothetical protein